MQLASLSYRLETPIVRQDVQLFVQLVFVLFVLVDSQVCTSTKILCSAVNGKIGQDRGLKQKKKGSRVLQLKIQPAMDEKKKKQGKNELEELKKERNEQGRHGRQAKQASHKPNTRCHPKSKSVEVRAITEHLHKQARANNAWHGMAIA